MSLIWGSREEKEQWADDHGYSRYRCPKCHKTFWTDSAVECPTCGPEQDSEGDE